MKEKKGAALSDVMVKKSIKGFMWAGIELLGRQGISLVIQIILARLLSPSDFGLIGMLAIFTGLATTITDSGFQTWLLQKKAPTSSDYSTVYLFNIFASLVLYFGLFLISPLIASFYNEPILEELLKILGLTIIFGAFSMVHRVKLSRKMDFKSQAVISTFAMLLSGGVAIVIAYLGFGVWSLVVQQILNQFLQTILLILANRWTPKLTFSVVSFKQMFHYGWKILLSSMLDTVYSNGSSVFIGKFFSTSQLGYYTNGRKISDVASLSLAGTVQKVSFPMLSQLKENRLQMQESFRKILMMISFVSFPLMLGLSAVGEEAILFLFGSKWLAAVPYFKLLSIAAMFMPMHILNILLLQIIERTDRYLKLEIIKKILALFAMVFALITFRSVIAIVWADVIVGTLSLVLNAYYTKEIINYSLLEQLKDVKMFMISSILMYLVIFLVGLLIEGNLFLMLFCKVLIGMISYVVFISLLKKETRQLIIRWIKKIGG
ncbi:MAG: lipopolysaccharide biosynthesis protein [Enterococcus sp.]|nr:lipopolysaccharide biosynthesis protein [Enterococcus sp.]